MAVPYDERAAPRRHTAISFGAYCLNSAAAASRQPRPQSQRRPRQAMSAGERACRWSTETAAEAKHCHAVSGTIRYLCVQAGLLNAGAARGIRTPDPIITNDVLYRLSYCGLTNKIKSLSQNRKSLPANPMRIWGHVLSSGYSMIKETRQDFRRQGHRGRKRRWNASGQQSNVNGSHARCTVRALITRAGVVLRLGASHQRYPRVIEGRAKV